MSKPSVNTVQAARESDRARRQRQTGRIVQCTQCGQRHQPRACPAFGQECGFCKKLHHFAKMCWNKQALTKSKELKQSSQRRPQKENGSGTNLKGKVHQVEQQQETSSEESTDEAPCLNIDPVSVEGVKKASAWFADLGIQGGKLSVKIDVLK